MCRELCIRSCRAKRRSERVQRREMVLARPSVGLARRSTVICIARGGAQIAIVGRGGPTGQQVQGVVGGRVDCGGVDEQALGGVGGKRQGLEGQLEVTDDRMVDEFDAGRVDADVVGGPTASEVVAAGGELSDEVGQVTVVGIAACFGAEQRD